MAVGKTAQRKPTQYASRTGLQLCFSTNSRYTSRVQRRMRDKIARFQFDEPAMFFSVKKSQPAAQDVPRRILSRAFNCILGLA